MARRYVETDAELAARGLDRWGFPLRPGQVVTPPLPRVPRLRTPRPARSRPPQVPFVSVTDQKLLPGLRRLCETAAPGERLTRHEIAAACDVDKETIRNIEKRGLKKLRNRLGPSFLKQLGSVVPDLGDVSYRAVSFSS
jgi:hypothetical protein